MAYIETELANLQTHAQNLATEIAQREAALATMEKDSAGATVHADVIAERKRQLAEVTERIPRLEKTIADMKAATAIREKREAEILAARTKVETKPTEPQSAAT